MRIRLQILLPAAIAFLGLAACGIPDDGYAELKGEVQIPAKFLSLVVHPGDATSDCPADASDWGAPPAIGDTLPTVYVGIYKKALDPLNRAFNPAGDDTWRNGCGDIDEDDDPVTPPVHHDESCPIGGSTATYVQTISGTNGMAIFEFKALQLKTGNAFLSAWLDNQCADDNAPSASLVWDIGGPPGPFDANGDQVADGAPDDENDLVLYPTMPVHIGDGGNSLGDPIVLNSALSASQL